jgi:hypothetical protein
MEAEGVPPVWEGGRCNLGGFAVKEGKSSLECRVLLRGRIGRGGFVMRKE